MMSLKAFMRDFELVAKSSLLNPNEITKEALDEVSAQLSFCDLNKSPRWAIMDFALVRLKTILKIDLSEQDALLLKEASKNLVKNELNSTSNNGYELSCV